MAQDLQIRTRTSNETGYTWHSADGIRWYKTEQEAREHAGPSKKYLLHDKPESLISHCHKESGGLRGQALADYINRHYAHGQVTAEMVQGVGQTVCRTETTQLNCQQLGVQDSYFSSDLDWNPGIWPTKFSPDGGTTWFVRSREIDRGTRDEFCGYVYINQTTNKPVTVWND